MFSENVKITIYMNKNYNTFHIIGGKKQDIIQSNKKNKNY